MRATILILGGNLMVILGWTIHEPSFRAVGMGIVLLGACEIFDKRRTGA